MFLILFLNYWLIILIFAVLAQVFISTAEIIIAIRILTREAKNNIETPPVITEAKIVSYM